jgi:hypothetical protein
MRSRFDQGCAVLVSTPEVLSTPSEIPSKEGGPLACQSKDTAMRVHLFRSLGAHCGCVLKLSHGFMDSQMRAL